MRDRLIELLEKAFEFYIDDPYCIPDETEFADHLLANGVIVPPCNVGQTVYVISETKAKEAKVDELHIDSRNHITIFVNFECNDDCEGCPFEAWSQTFCGEWDCNNQYGIAEIKTEDFGKTVFLTKEEAEQALKEREK